jgi:hypothetical protein
MLQEGQVIRMVANGPPFRVVSVSECRAYCVPLKKGLVKDEGDVIEFGGFVDSKGGVNIAPRAYVEIVEGDLGEAEKRRQAAIAAKNGSRNVDRTDSNVTQTTENVMAASAMPVRSNREREKDRRARLASKAAGMPGRKLTGAAARSAGKAKAPRTVRKCFCGCGEETMGYFAPGHDGRFHGLMKKLERGEIEPKDIRKAQAEIIGPFKKFGEGWRPSKNYKGDPYKPH